MFNFNDYFSKFAKVYILPVRDLFPGVYVVDWPKLYVAPKSDYTNNIISSFCHKSSNLR